MSTFTVSQLAGFNKGQLRQACRAHGVNYAGMNNAGMVAALTSHAVSEDAAAEVQQDLAAGAAVAEAAVGVQPSTEQLNLAVQDGQVVAAELVQVPKVLPTIVAPPLHPTLEAPVTPVTPTPATAARKVQKDRAEANGVKRPSDGTICGNIWGYCDTVVAGGAFPSAKDLRAHGASQAPAWDATTCTVQYYRWRKFNGVQGRS